MVEVSMCCFDFNMHRCNIVSTHQWKVADELMPAFRPQTTKLDQLPNISFIMHKPEPLGMDTLFVCCFLHVFLLLHLLFQNILLFYSYRYRV